MKALTGLHTLPAFLPIVGDFYSGMLVTVPVFREDLLNGATIEDIRRVYQSRYRGPIVSYRENADESGFLSALSLSGLDRMDVSVFGNEDRIHCLFLVTKTASFLPRATITLEKEHRVPLSSVSTL